MIDLDGFFRDHQFWALFASAAGTATMAGLACANFRRTHTTANITALRQELDRLRGGTLDDAVAVNAAAAADPWAVLGAERDRACTVLGALSRAARVVDNPEAWDASLDGSEYATLSEFIGHVSPLILVLRATPLAVAGRSRPYNNDKIFCAHAILTALRTHVRVHIPLLWWFGSRR